MRAHRGQRRRNALKHWQVAAQIWDVYVFSSESALNLNPICRYAFNNEHAAWKRMIRR